MLKIWKQTWKKEEGGQGDEGSPGGGTQATTDGSTMDTERHTIIDETSDSRPSKRRKLADDSTRGSLRGMEKVHAGMRDVGATTVVIDQALEQSKLSSELLSQLERNNGRPESIL